MDEKIVLTEDEITVLCLSIKGLNVGQIAEKLGKPFRFRFMQERYVQQQLANIFDKLEVTNRVQAFRRATRLGLIPEDVFSLHENPDE